MDNRGISEVLGVLLTIVLIVFLVGILAGPALNSIDPRGTQTFIRVSVNESHVVISNHGGDQLALDTSTVVVRSEGQRNEFALNASKISSNGDGDTVFEQGEVWTGAHGLNVNDGGPVSVYLFTPKGQVAAKWSGRVEFSN